MTTASASTVRSYQPSDVLDAALQALGCRALVLAQVRQPLAQLQGWRVQSRRRPRGQAEFQSRVPVEPGGRHQGGVV